MFGLVGRIKEVITRPIRKMYDGVVFWYVEVSYETENGIIGQQRITYKTMEECLTVYEGMEIIV